MSDQPHDDQGFAGDTRLERGRARRPAVALAGWWTATWTAVLALIVALVPAEAAAFGFDAAGRSGSPVSNVARAGGLLFYAFHHVELVFGTGAGRAVGSLGFSGTSFTVTAVVAVALILAGRAVALRAAEVAGGRGSISSLAGGLHGTKVALPYALACLAGTAAVRYPVRLTGGSAAPVVLSGAATVHPSVVQAGLWPLALGVVFGFLGGFRSSGRAGTASSERESWMRGAVAGGATMAVLGLVLSFAGLLVLAAAKPDATRAYLDWAFRGGTPRGLAVLGLTVLVVPNLAAWVLFPAMGACVRTAATGAGTVPLGVGGAAKTCAISYARLPRGGLAVLSAQAPAHPGFVRAPSAYLLFLLAPALAVVAGGVVAARRSGAAGRGRSAAAGALAGAVFGVFAVLLVLLAGVAVSVGLRTAGSGVVLAYAAGPDRVLGPLLALAWGVVGGAVGGFLWGVRGRSEPGDSGGPASPGPPGGGGPIPATPG